MSYFKMRLMAIASVEGTGGTFRAGKRRQVLEGIFRGGIGGIPLAGNIFADWDVTRDGQRFILFPSVEDSGQVDHPHVTLVTHWFDELRRTFGGSN